MFRDNLFFEVVFVMRVFLGTIIDLGIFSSLFSFWFRFGSFFDLGVFYIPKL